MKILYLHGFCANLNGKKASCLRTYFGQHAVIEPPAPGLPYCKSLMKPLLEELGDRFQKQPTALLGLLGPNRIAEMKAIAIDHISFFARSVEIAQKIYDQSQPDIIVGSSLGGSVAMAISSKDTPMVLVGPVWNRRVKAAVSTDHMPNAGPFQKLLLSAGTIAMRSPIAQFAGFNVPELIKPQTIILHSAHDKLFAAAHSRQLLRSSPIAANDPIRPRVDRVIAQLSAAGYANKKSTAKPTYNDGRLIVIGKDHHTNEADPDDRINQDPHPHSALIAAVDLLHQEFAGSPTTIDVGA
jgi:predicted esterase YcpF (UPF0227 family)